MRYFLHLSYNGTNYHGWQFQKNIQPTIQEVLENALSSMLARSIKIFGCGRTDAQVHASQYFAHVDIDKELDFDPVFRLNKMLPSDIAIHELIPVHNGAHAQFDAVSRTYDYYIHSKKNPFLKDFSVERDTRELNIDLMQQMVDFISTQNDFRSMCKSPDQYKHTKCNVQGFVMNYDQETGNIRFTITANRFLQGMVRLLIGRILDVGRGFMTVEQIKDCFEKAEAPQLHISAYPQGLYLSKVIYEYLTIPAEFSELNNMTKTQL